MPGIVQGRAQEVVYACINNGQPVGRAFFYVKYFREQGTCGANKVAARLKQKLKRASLKKRPQTEGEIFRSLGLVIWAVGDAQSSTYVQVLEFDALFSQQVPKLQKVTRRFEYRRNLQQLRANVSMEAMWAQVRMCGRLQSYVKCFLQRYAKLGSTCAGGYMGMRAGVNIGIHPDGDRRYFTQRGGYIA
jgi:hypothetical protein